ncbi:MAG: hypothetical protein EA365_10115 [Gloeocapsa sp. DLM2.Bin57]|nr:MAG: hypothetical protein EA365_10115 [Gloeocapsa sp. DLM2.Bin57]
MLNHPQDISSFLAGSFLENRVIRSLIISESSQVALAINITQAESLPAWELLRSFLPQTQPYPLITLSWSDEDYFSRFYYQEESAD